MNASLNFSHRRQKSSTFDVDEQKIKSETPQPQDLAYLQLAVNAYEVFDLTATTEAYQNDSLAIPAQQLKQTPDLSDKCSYAK